MFEHSIKVPRQYKVAANIFKKVSTEGGSVKTLLYDDKLRHFRTNVLYALITETIKHASDLDKIFESCKILETESRLDPWLAKVLTAELLFGKKSLPGKSKPEQTILSYKEQFEKYATEHRDDLKTEVTPRPRYVRINTNLLTTSDAIRAFQDEGYRFIRCTSGSYEEYLKQIQGLTEYDFTQDYHVKTVFVFAAGTKLHDHELYLENKIILQDKATTMAVHLLAPPAGSVALDLCAAPGMKTTQLAAYMRNNGKIYAVERNEKRFATLRDFVTKTGCNIVETIHRDALEIKRGEMDEVEYILLDPSCSGSGMDFCVHSYIDSDRLAKLTSLQEKFLKHAMNAFPKAKRIVYSTCSLYPEENERVITNVVKTSRAKWRVQDVKELLKGQWNNFGSAMYGSMGTRCMYAKPDTDLTTGFFLAVLDRDPKDMEKSLRNEENRQESRKKESAKTKSHDDVEENHDKDDENIETPLHTETVDGEEPKTKKKKNKKEKNRVIGETAHVEVNIDQVIEDTETMPKKKTKKRKHENDQSIESVAEILNDLVVENNDNDDSVPKKKKRKDKSNTENAVETHSIISEDVNNFEVNSDIWERKKRKKVPSEENSENLEETQPTKKKNKSKNIEANDSMQPESMDFVTSEPPKKKKKKKDKENNDE